MGKSYVTAAFVLWLLYNDPGLNIAVISAGHDRAERFTGFCLKIIMECPFLAHMRPKKDDKQSLTEFSVRGAPISQSVSVTSYSITGQVTGSRADVIIFDDVEIPSNTETILMREKLSHRVKEGAALLKPITEVMLEQNPEVRMFKGRIIYLGTPQCEDSLYDKLLERGYEARIWPVLYPDEKWMQHRGHMLAPRLAHELQVKGKSIVGTTTEPQRFSMEHIEAARLEYGEEGFELQFMLNTSLADADRHPLKLKDIIVADLDPDFAPINIAWTNDPANQLKDLPVVGLRGDRYYQGRLVAADGKAEYTGRVMAIDPSGRGKDETTYAVVFYSNGRLYLMDAGAVKAKEGYGDEALNELAQVALKWKVNEVLVEENYGGGMFTKLLSPVMASIHRCTITEVRHSKQKELRIIDTLEPVLTSHRLVVDRKVIQKDYESTRGGPKEERFIYQLFWQMTRITRSKGSLKHDDRLDALAMAVAYWADSMQVSIEQAVQRARAERLQEELRKFEGHVLLHPQAPASKSWETI